MLVITANQLVAHAIGDYVLQSDWMANQKIKRLWIALVHALTYYIPFAFLVPDISMKAWLVIVITHAVIDRWRLARYVCWLKNWSAIPWIPQFKIFYRCPACSAEELRIEVSDKADPKATCIECGGSLDAFGCSKHTLNANYPWSKCRSTGYYEGRPAWLSVWLMIITDNLMHICINAAAIQYL